MKKAFLFLASLGFVTMLLPATVSAAAPAATPTKTKVRGVVTHNDKAVKNANITVICKNIVRYAVTDKDGEYEVSYNKDKCPLGSTVNVTATKNRLGGNAKGTVGPNTLTLNLAIVNVALPEFGVLTGVAAVGLGGAAFLYVRSRQAAGA